MVMKITIKLTLLMSLAALAAQANDDAGSSAASLNTDEAVDIIPMLEQKLAVAMKKSTNLESFDTIKILENMKRMTGLPVDNAEDVEETSAQPTPFTEFGPQTAPPADNAEDVEETSAQPTPFTGNGTNSTTSLPQDKGNETNTTTSPPQDKDNRIEETDAAFDILRSRINEYEDTIAVLKHDNDATKTNMEKLTNQIQNVNSLANTFASKSSLQTLANTFASKSSLQTLENIVATKASSQLVTDENAAIKTSLNALIKETQAHDAIREKQYLEIAGFRTNINTRLTSVTNGLNGHANKFDSLTSTMTGLSRKMSTLTSDLSKIKTRVNTRVFFTVRSPNNKAARGEPMKFQTIITNFGSGYSAATGAFTAPVSGWYLFTFFYTSSTADKYAYLQLDGHEMVRAFADYEADYKWNENSAGNAAVLYVKKGQKVTVTGGSTNDLTTPTFTGVLLSTDLP